MMDAKLLELVCADSEGNDFYEKDAEGRQESERQSIRLYRSSRANQKRFHQNEQAGKVRTYSCQALPRQGEVSSLIPGERRWINAVAMMTPEPKYFAVLWSPWVRNEIARERERGQRKGEGGGKPILECGAWYVEHA